MSENGNSNGNKKSIISKDSLMPVGVVVILCSIFFNVGKSWNSMELRGFENVKDISSLENRVKVLEHQVNYWRRWLEVQLGKPIPDAPKDEGN